jgi:DNA-directed RNA polymerase subunit RPC12/RpoP
MTKKITICKKCRQEILQANPTKCPYCKSEEFVTEEESQMEAETAQLKPGKVASISLLCPYCGAKQSVSAKLDEIKCLKCGQKYVVPEKARALL